MIVEKEAIKGEYIDKIDLLPLDSVDEIDSCLDDDMINEAEPLIEKKGTPASPAVAFPKRVFPVPGGPTNKTPFGIFPPKRVNFRGSFRKSTSNEDDDNEREDSSFSFLIRHPEVVPFREMLFWSHYRRRSATTAMIADIVMTRSSLES